MGSFLNSKLKLTDIRHQTLTNDQSEDQINAVWFSTEGEFFIKNYSLRANCRCQDVFKRCPGKRGHSRENRLNITLLSVTDFSTPKRIPVVFQHTYHLNSEPVTFIFILNKKACRFETLKTMIISVMFMLNTNRLKTSRVSLCGICKRLGSVKWSM